MKTRNALLALAIAGSLCSIGAGQLPIEPETKTASESMEERDHPYAIGEKLPNFVLPALGEDGEVVEASLETMLQNGPVVVTFFRGGWCPYCVTELKAIEKRLKKIEALGASVLAISPEEPTHTKKLDKKLHIGFTLATDHDNQVARELGLLFQMPDDMIEQYGKYNLDVPQSNGTDSWELPIPATYVIDTDRTIRFAFADEDYSKRADYDDVLEVLKEIKDE